MGADVNSTVVERKKEKKGRKEAWKEEIRKRKKYWQQEVQVVASCIYLKYGCHNQTLYLSYAQLEEVMSWNTSVGFGCPNEPLLRRVLCCNHRY